jgi:hypothetical protein
MIEATSIDSIPDDPYLRRDHHVPDVVEFRARVAAALDLPAAAGLSERLHAAAVDDGYVVVSDQGDRYEPLAVWLRT